jgi:hypothetical protein
MLNRAKLMREIQQVATNLFPSYVHEYSYVYEIWQQIATDPSFSTRITTAHAPWPLPLWQGSLDAVIPVNPQVQPYTIMAIDGSQIYPDRHQGTSCFLINIGSAIFSYGLEKSSVTLDSFPYFFIDDPRMDIAHTVHDGVDGMRQEYELAHGVELGTTKTYTPNSSLILFDGTLIFWHVDTKDAAYKNYFLPRYCAYLATLAHNHMPMASYISLPRSKEVMNLVRFAARDRLKNDQQEASITNLTDAALMMMMLSPHTRTTIFMSKSSICNEYPEHVRPYFFYLHVGTEIARVELPAWIARDEVLVSMIASTILDQCTKGQGYPVSLAEAHEQAVIKGVDRDFFYHLIRKISIAHNQRVNLSPKNTKKKSLGI